MRQGIAEALNKIGCHDGSLSSICFDYDAREIRICFEQDLEESNVLALFREYSVDPVPGPEVGEPVRICLDFYAVSSIESTECSIRDPVDAEIYSGSFEQDQNACRAQFLFLAGFSEGSWQLRFSFEKVLIRLPAFNGFSLMLPAV